MAAYDKRGTPHRRLKSGMRGADVKALQSAVNLRLKRKKARTKIAVDGEWGPRSQLAYRRAANLIGLPHYLPTRACQAIMRNPSLRTPAMRARSQRNVAAWKARKAGTPGVRAVRHLARYVGKTETAYNDAPWLRAWEDSLPHNRLDWMIPGNPYCGLGDIVGWWGGAKKLLPDDTVSTVAIANRARSGNGYRRVSLSEAKPGDLVVFHFGSGGPKHTGLLRQPIRGGTVHCTEANTSPGSGGSQSNGGGVWNRSRPVGFIHSIARPK